MRRNIDPHESLPLFERRLIEDNLAPNTVRAYRKAVDDYLRDFDSLTKHNLLLHRSRLMEHYAPKTVNLRLMALNRWLTLLRRPAWRLKGVRLGRRSFVENVISQADYLYLARTLRERGELRWHFIVRFLAATGARVSELVQLRVEHVRSGFVDLYSKGCKLRRIYIPARLRSEALAWLAERGEEASGPLFLNYRGARITPRGIGAGLRTWARRLRIDPATVHPHAFRHRFAKNFLAVHTDLSLLADLLGHESIETTRIYLCRTASEQRAVVDRCVTW